MLFRIVFGLLAAVTKEFSFRLWRFHELMVKATAWADKRVKQISADRTVFIEHMSRKGKVTGVEGTTILTEVEKSEVDASELPTAHPVG